MSVIISSAAAAPADAPAVLVAVASPATDAGGNAYNQDRSFVQTDNGITTIGVFDGHGTYGAEIAQAAAEIAATQPTSTDPTALMAALEDAARNVIATANPDAVREGGAFYRRFPWGGKGAPIRGGTTATICRIAADGSMTVSHLGDSDCVFWDTDDAAPSTLMADHTAASVSEFERIRAAYPSAGFRFDDQGGRLLRGRAPRPVFVHGDPPLAPSHATTPPDAPWILNPKGGYCYADVRGTWGVYFEAPDGQEALAMTRAIGDFHLKRYGLSIVPSVIEAPPPAPGRTRAIVTASDGLWDAVQLDEVRDLVRRPDLLGNAIAATAELMRWGLEKARGHFGPNCDNITVAVTYVTVPLPPAAEPQDPPPPPTVCPLHGGPPTEDGAPPALGYSKNSRGEYSTYAPCCNGATVYCHEDTED